MIKKLTASTVSEHESSAKLFRDGFLSEIDSAQESFHRAQVLTSASAVALVSAVRAPHPCNALLRALGAGAHRVTLHRTGAFSDGAVISLERELLVSDVSDGLPQPVVVAAARLDGGAPFCLKLRRATPSQGATAGGRSSAHVELANMLAIATSPTARQLFPRLLFHFRLDLPAGSTAAAVAGGGAESWVGIGLDLVERAVPEALTGSNRRLVAGLVAAGARHLRRLHAAGLAHGDAHTGNLMYNERRLPSGAAGLQLLSIDADRVRPLGPPAASAVGLAVLRQWADVQQLLYWNNPMLGGAVRRPAGWSWADVFSALHGDAAVQRLSCGTVPPTDFFMDMENSDQLADFVGDPEHRVYVTRVCAADSAVPGGALDAALARLCADDCRAMEELGHAVRICLSRGICGHGAGGGCAPGDASQSMVV